jgi:hypothetical protein
MKRLALMLAALSCSAAPLRAAPGAEYVLSEGRFAVRPPKGWTASRDPRQDARQKVYGVALAGPRSADGILSAIDVAYYPPGNALFKGGAAEYLKRNRGDDDRFVKPAGETTGPLEKAVVGGLPAQSFTRRTREYIPPDRTDSRAVAVVEEIAVVPAGDGFYVVVFKSSEQLHDSLKAVFARALASLRFTGAAKP